ncbi:hypothetical protein ACOBWL_003439 [Vibrio cholerae]
MKYYILAVVVLNFMGCSNLAKNYTLDAVLTQTASTESYITDDGSIDLSKVELSKFDGSSNQSNRNHLIAKAISLSDEKCEIHKAGIISNANAWNVGSGTAAILFAGTASVISHAQTAAELAAAAAATSGIQSLVNKEIYADMLGTTILRSIEVVREKKRAVLDAGMKDPDYSVSLAIIDIQNYHNSCSLMAGLVEVTKAFENRKPSRNELVRDIAIIKDEIQNAQTTFKDVDPKVRQAVVDKYAEDLKELTLALSGASD